MENQESAQQHLADHVSTDSPGMERQRSLIAKKRVKDKNESLLMSISVNIAMVVVGSLAFGKCPVEPYIPFYLVAFGFVSFIAKCTTALREWGGQQYFKSTATESVLHVAELILLLLGGFWVYKEYPPSYDPNDGEKYCQKTVYQFAFIFTTIIYAFLFLVLATLILCLPCICFFSKQFRNKDDVEANFTSEEARSQREGVETI
ncbi:unnamed protein product [Callosobruchus maculatus]|uniref:Uncharacterized protein n=1 Tax=Callosobruchus maculatus TaxID=64391 RepID=A0A653CEV2_CALMS|nr:unnamed protein product [Callosobruchus maculatus]